MFNKKALKLKEEQCRELSERNAEYQRILEEIYRMMGYTFTKLEGRKIGNTRALKQLRTLKDNIGRVLGKVLDKHDNSL